MTQKHVNIVVIGAGPATLGLLCNALKTDRLKDLVEKDGGLAILEQGDAFGGGALSTYGINSNTSANGILKCTYTKKDTYKTPVKKNNKMLPESAKKEAQETSDNEGPQPDHDDILAETDSQPKKQYVYTPLDAFKDLVNIAPIFQAM